MKIVSCFSGAKLARAVRMPVLLGLITAAVLAGSPAPDGQALSAPAGLPKFHVIVHNPGDGNQTVSDKSSAPVTEEASGPVDLPNYKGETLTLALVGRNRENSGISK